MNLLIPVAHLNRLVFFIGFNLLRVMMGSSSISKYRYKHAN